MRIRNNLSVPYEYFLSFLYAFDLNPKEKFEEWGIPMPENQVLLTVQTSYENFISDKTKALSKGTLSLDSYIDDKNENDPDLNMWFDMICYFNKRNDLVSSEFISAFELFTTKRLRVPLETLILTETEPDQISILFTEVSSGYSVTDIVYFIEKFYNIGCMKKSSLISHIEAITEESEAFLKSEALEGDLDQIKYLLNMSCDLDDYTMMDSIAKDAFFNYKKGLKEGSIDDVKLYSDIFFKSQDRLLKLNKADSKDKELPFKININFETDNEEIIDFEMFQKENVSE